VKAHRHLLEDGRRTAGWQELGRAGERRAALLAGSMLAAEGKRPPGHMVLASAANRPGQGSGPASAGGMYTPWGTVEAGREQVRWEGPGLVCASLAPARPIIAAAPIIAKAPDGEPGQARLQAIHQHSFASPSSVLASGVGTVGPKVGTARDLSPGLTRAREPFGGRVAEGRPADGRRRSDIGRIVSRGAER
jgi:hypothetical protein